MNLDFLALNLTGYVFYTIYCSYGYFCEGSAAETGRVNLNDIFFVYHALMITLVMVVQAFIYPKGTNRITPFTVGLIIMLVSFSAVYSLLTYVKCVTLRFSSTLSQRLIYLLLASWGILRSPSTSSSVGHR